MKIFFHAPSFHFPSKDETITENLLRLSTQGRERSKRISTLENHHQIQISSLNHFPQSIGCPQNPMISEIDDGLGLVIHCSLSCRVFYRWFERVSRFISLQFIFPSFFLFLHFSFLLLSFSFISLTFPSHFPSFFLHFLIFPSLSFSFLLFPSLSFSFLLFPSLSFRLDSP